MSTVIENLKEALIGESKAKRNYELFAQKAKEENFIEISYLFKAISFAESIHIKNHLKALEKISKKSIILDEFIDINEKELEKNVKDTRKNLIQAIEGETYEFKNMYKSFIKSAKKEDYYLAEFSFDLARKAEKVHGQLFSKYLKKLENNEIFEKRDLFVCQICGNVELDNPPKICPNCEHDQKFFKKIAR